MDDASSLRRRGGGDRRGGDHQLPPDGVVVWSARKAVATLLLIVSTVAATLTLSATIGLRWGPREDVRQLSNRVDTNTARIRVIQDVIATYGNQLRDLQEGQRFQQYLMCIQLRRTDPAALPPECTPITRRQR